MSDEGEMILGLCSLPVLNDSSFIVREDLEDEVITGNITDFPILREENEVTRDNVIGKPTHTPSRIHHKKNRFSSNQSCPKSKVPESFGGERLSKRKRRSLETGRSHVSCRVSSLANEDAHSVEQHLISHPSVEKAPESDSTKDESSVSLNGSQDCAVCGRSFGCSSQLKKHIIQMHNKSVSFLCPICGHILRAWKSVVIPHMSSHAGKIECPTCCFQASEIKIIDDHISAEGSGHLCCKLCGSRFNNRLDFFTHVNDHIPKCAISEPMFCPFCDSKFYKTLAFNNHIKTNVCRNKKKKVPIAPQSDRNRATQNVVDVIDISSDVSEGNNSISAVPIHSHEKFLMVTTVANNSNTTFTVTPQTPGITPVLTLVSDESNLSSVCQNQVLLFASEQPIVEPVLNQKSIETVVNGETFQLSKFSPVDLASKGFEDDECVIVDAHQFSENSSMCLSVQNVYNQASVSNDLVMSNSPKNLPSLVCSISKKTQENSEAFEKHYQKQKLQSACDTTVIPCSKDSSCSFECNDCGQSFAFQKHLVQHLVTFHKDLKGIVCPVCKETMSEKDTSFSDHLAQIHKLYVDQSVGCRSTYRIAKVK